MKATLESTNSKRKEKRTIELILCLHYMEERSQLIKALSNKNQQLPKVIKYSLWFRLNWITQRLREIYRTFGVY